VFSHLRSTILSAHYGDDVRQQAFGELPDGYIKQRVYQRLSSKKGDGQENRRLVAFSFRFLNRPNEKRAGCAQQCAQTVCPKRGACGRYKALL
jgi:hypothetical protein